MAHESHASLLGVLGEILHHSPGRTGGRQRVGRHHRGLALQRLRNHVCSLTGTQERTRDDLIDGDAQLIERLRLLAESRNALRRERALRVVRIFVAALLGHSVANQIQRECRHASVSLSAGGCRLVGGRGPACSWRQCHLETANAASRPQQQGDDAPDSRQGGAQGGREQTCSGRGDADTRLRAPARARRGCLREARGPAASPAQPQRASAGPAGRAGGQACPALSSADERAAAAIGNPPSAAISRPYRSFFVAIRTRCRLSGLYICPASAIAAASAFDRFASRAASASRHFSDSAS